MKFPRSGDAAARVFAALGFVLFLYSIWTLFETVVSVHIPFDTDEADHANAALELYRSLQSRSPGAVWEAVRRQAFYPPLYSFFIAPSYRLFGLTLLGARAPSVFFYALSGILLSAAVSRSLATKPASVRIFSSALPLIFLSTSPLVIEYSGLCMIEGGAIFLVSCVLFGAHDVNQARRYSILGASIVASIFLKYNFAVLIVPGILISLVLVPPCRLSENASSWLHAAFLGAAGGAVFLLWILVSYRDSVLHFFVGHPSYSPLLSAENLFFEIKSWFKEYAPNYFVAGWTLLLGVAGAVRQRHACAVRVAYGITLCSFAILLLSTTNEARHFVVAAPCIWYLASIGTAEALDSQLRDLVPAVLIVVIGSLSWGAFKVTPQLRHLSAKAMEGDPHFSLLQNGIFAAANPAAPALVLGATDQFSIESLRWEAARRSGLPYTQVRVDAYPFRNDKNVTARLRKRNVAYPFLNPGFPKDPLNEVLKQNYYQSLILIRAIGDRGEVSSLLKSIKESYADKRVFQDTQAGLEVTVFSLR